MRSVLDRLRSLDPARADAIVALVYLAEVTFEMFVFVGDPRPEFGIAMVCEVVLAGGLAVRRRWPMVAALGGFVALGVITALSPVYTDHLITTWFVVLFLVYSAGRHLDDRRAIAVAVLGSIAATLTLTVDTYDDSPANVITSVVFIAWAPVLIGRFMRHRARLHTTLLEKAQRLERERDTRAESAAQEERTRIAGELHDVVAHALSAMVVQAGAARRLTQRDPARAGEAFHAVEDTGREALTEIRALLGVLRREDEDLALAPQPSLRHVNSLVGRARAAGLPVELTIEGEERELPAGVDLTAYRVVQSALKAAFEQGHAGRASVVLRFALDAVVLEVDDDGGSPDRPLPGVPERVALYGGQLRSAARREGGHLVRARIPVEGAA